MALVEEVASLQNVAKMESRVQEAEAQPQEAEAQARESVSWAVDDYKELSAFKVDAAIVGAGLYVMGFESCKKVVAASFLNLDLQAILLPDEEGDKAKEEAKGPEEGEAVPTEAPALLTIEEVEPAIEEVLSTVIEAKIAIETPSLVGVKVVIPLKGGSLAKGHIEVPLPSWALEPSDNAAEIKVTQVSK